MKVLSVKEKEKLSFRKTAKRFDVGVASILRWSKNIKPLTIRNKPATKINMEALKRIFKTTLKRTNMKELRSLV
ncbi:MAG: hypothetical protein KFB95_05515 [Simkaniaceae bacterium]|nr:MAG: hypothetical protein KFB95_05515 [Simkaniaceae bacterium]